MTSTRPSGTLDRDALAARFGPGRADLALHARAAGDPLADAVVAEIRAAGRDRGRALTAQLQRGIRDGLAALRDPSPAVAALLTSAESLPEGVDPAVLDTGIRPSFTAPPAVHTLSLSAGALLRTYGSPSIAVLLGTTGRLVESAERRLTETGTWLLAATLPGGMRPGSPGYVGTLQVRVLHARMRLLARDRGLDEAVHGTPVNQVDLVRTWLDFTLVSMRAEATIGFGLTRAETAEVYACWHLLAHQLGIDRELVRDITSHAAAEELDALVTAVTGPPVAESRALAGALVDAVAALLVEPLRLPAPQGRRLLQALARRFHGAAVTTGLGLRRSPGWEVAVAVLARAIAVQRRWVRRSPAALAAAQARNVAATRALLAEDRGGATLFQTHGA
ncbi:oxygenase MpaB family protein [Pseudonocardia sp. ICBG1293]|uniref:oxygenase MpaB family protein n=1 Tax=Pseudonocardia sp. ICBG1293 TaxID=2844382 RepID=UPI001CCFA41E|nr:oxygenase MpaB family protein [Pseudonocardia sp. ICBG1293]